MGAQPVPTYLSAHKRLFAQEYTHVLFVVSVFPLRSENENETSETKHVIQLWWNFWFFLLSLSIICQRILLVHSFLTPKKDALKLAKGQPATPPKQCQTPWRKRRGSRRKEERHWQHWYQIEALRELNPRTLKGKIWDPWEENGGDKLVETAIFSFTYCKFRWLFSVCVQGLLHTDLVLALHHLLRHAGCTWRRVRDGQGDNQNKHTKKRQKNQEFFWKKQNKVSSPTLK